MKLQTKHATQANELSPPQTQDSSSNVSSILITAFCLRSENLKYQISFIIKLTSARKNIQNKHLKTNLTRKNIRYLNKIDMLMYDGR